MSLFSPPLLHFSTIWFTMSVPYGSEWLKYMVGKAWGEELGTDFCFAVD